MSPTLAARGIAPPAPGHCLATKDNTKTPKPNRSDPLLATSRRYESLLVPVPIEISRDHALQIQVHSPTDTRLLHSALGTSPQKSPLRRLFNKGASVLSLSPSPSSSGTKFNFNLSALSPSPTKAFSLSTTSVAYEIHLYDFADHSELMFEPHVPTNTTPTSNSSPATMHSGRGTGLVISPTHGEHEIPTTPIPASSSSYRITCQKMTPQEVVLGCKDDTGSIVARLRTTGRSTEVQIKGTDEVITVDERDTGIQKVHVDGVAYNWTETMGLALLVNLETRRTLAKVQYKMFGRDKLVITDEGLDRIPLVIITAAKVWSEHHGERSFRWQ